MTTDREETQQQDTVQAEQTPTMEEQLKQAQEEVARLTRQYEEKDKGLRTAHQTLTQKDRELKAQMDLTSKLDSLDQKIRILAAAQATGMRMDENTLENMSPQTQQNLLSQFDRLDAETKARAEQASKQAEEQEYRTRADALWQEAQSMDIPEETLDRIEDSLMYGRLDRAERLIEKNRKVETKTEVDVEKLVAERLKEELAKRNIEIEEEGLLETDTAVPSGRTATQQETLDRYASGDPTVSREDVARILGV